MGKRQRGLPFAATKHSMVNREEEPRGTHRLSGEERESVSSGWAPPIRASHVRDVCCTKDGGGC
jgi:hypothetical protein